MIVKKLLKKYKYPPEGQEDALKTVISQCELWTDNDDFSEYGEKREIRYVLPEENDLLVASPSQ